jgi:uncharacterized small protein (DUF1192 family)
MNEPIMQYVSKKVFDEVWKELQELKSGTPTKLAVVSFQEAYDVGILHDRIKELEAEVEMLKAQLTDGIESIKSENL